MSDQRIGDAAKGLLDQKLPLGQGVQGLDDVRQGLLGHGLEQAGREGASDDRSPLQMPPQGKIQVVETGQDEAVEGGGDLLEQLFWIIGRRRSWRVILGNARHPPIQEHAHELLHIKGVAFGPGGQGLGKLRRVEAGLTQELLDKFRLLLRSQGRQLDIRFPERTPFQPGQDGLHHTLPFIGPGDEQKQHRKVGQVLQELQDKLSRGRVDPVDVLQDQDCGALLALGPQHL